MDDDAQMDALDKCPHCDVLVYSPDGICPACGKTLDVEGHKLDFSQVDELTDHFDDPDCVLPDYDLARDIEREK